MTDAPRARRVTAALERGRWPLTGALLLALLAVSGALAGLFEGGAWWLVLMGIGVPLLLVPAVLRVLGVPPLLASSLDLVLAIVVISATFGLAPSPEGVARAGELLRAAGIAIEEGSVPMPSIDDLLIVILVGAGLVAVVLDLLAVTAPALVGIPLLLVVAVRSFLAPDGIGVLPLAGVAVAYLVVLWADGRFRRRDRGAVGLVIVAASTAVALGATLLLPGLEQRWWKDVWREPPARAASLVDLARDFQQASATEVLRFRTEQMPAPNLQLATLEVYDGTTWVHRDGAERVLRPGTVLPAPIGPGFGGTVTDFVTEIELRGLGADWAPAPYPALAVGAGAGAGEWFSDRRDYSLRVEGAALADQIYQVLSAELSAEPEEVGGGGLPRDVLPALELPADVPQLVIDTARRVTEGARTPLEQASALQSYLRVDGGFTYSTATPDPGSDDGMSLVAAFLERRSGYCIHFASAMTVMARSLGIPARIAIGYLPGTAVDDPRGGEYYSVSNRELHAWPQLYFADVGWLAFEPTVGRGTPPAYSGGGSAITGSDTMPTSTPTSIATPTPSPSSAPDRDQGDAGVGSDPAAIAAGNSARMLAGIVTWAGAGLLLVAILLVPATWRGLRRRRRLRSLAAGGAPATAWSEILDTARDVGIEADPALTPRAFAERLAALSASIARDDLDAIVLEVERAAFGPPGGALAREDLAPLTASVLRSVAASGSRSTRFLARFAPRSLLGRLRARRERRGPS